MVSKILTWLQVTFINSIVMPDPGLGEDSESEEENDDE